MVPLLLVYFAEYAMQSGTWTAIGPPLGRDRMYCCLKAPLLAMRRCLQAPLLAGSGGFLATCMFYPSHGVPHPDPCLDPCAAQGSQ